MIRRIKAFKMPSKRAINGIFQTIRTTKIFMIGTFVAVLAAILACGVLIWTAHRHDNMAKFRMQVSTPAAAEFTDNNSIELAQTPNAIPAPNNNRRLSAPDTVIVSYELASDEYAPATRPEVSDTEIEKYAKITPFVRGTWHRYGYNRLAFTPEESWPADTKYTIRINRNLFNPDAVIDHTRATFTTSTPTATVDSFALYPSQNKKSVVGVAVISFNYAVYTKDFADRVTLRLDGNRVDFSVKFDKFHRTAFITSAPVEITDRTQIMRLKINRVPVSSSDAKTPKITAKTIIESADNIFKISSLTTTVADDAMGQPQQLILLDMTAAADTGLSKHINAYLLPRDKDTNDNDAPYKWQSDEITNDVLKASKKLDLHQIDFSNPAGVYQYAFAYDVSEKEDRFIYVDVTAGATSDSGFTLKNGATRVLAVPYPARTVSIAGSGALLAMGGDKKLGITARGGVDTAYVNLYKVKATEINHLISQSYGLFSSLEFKSWAFGAYDMSVVFRKSIPFSDTSMKTVNYASVDLGDYLDRTRSDKTGIFIVQTGASENAADYSDMRLIMLTDLGIIRKVNLDESSTVFVSSLTRGGAAPDTEIYVLGRNGNSVWAGRTDENGRVEIPALPWREYRQEKQPVAIVARAGDDVSFIPYDAYDRQVEYSKFDIDGAYANTASLQAYVFSDRGIYRPGETAIIGAIIKSRSFKTPAGVPVRVEIRDARGRIAFTKTVSLTSDGLIDVKYQPAENAVTGEYHAQIFSIGPKNQNKDMLGSTSFRVEEFVPDTLKIRTTIVDADNKNGWVTPESLTATVSLHNLFGTPATDKRITARAILTPAQFKFENFPNYIFTPNFIADTGLATRSATRTITQEIADVTTDQDGNATLSITFENPEDIVGTYNMTLTANGFEGGSGRSVQAGANARVSNAKYLVGYHTNSDLAYINRGATRAVKFIAVDNAGNATAASDLTLQIIKRENLTSLIKDYSDTYKYQTITRDKVILSQPMTIPANGTDVNLDTENSGTYYMRITDSSDRILANLEYFVAGDENTNLSADTQAELKIKLNAAEYAPGDDIAISITAPYAGSGLITIERDKVYAYRWFKSTTTTSVQHITVPDNFEGTGYINVSFVRDINSHDIFTTPYAYAVAPFSADVARRRIGIKLSAPAVVRDGKLHLEYETDKNARLMIFATNTGILQVAGYKLPNPIAHFFQKAALQVNTYQILSLLLPEYKILREFAKTGGGDYDDAGATAAGISNPFGRRTDAPVAFYSEILDAKANTSGEITFDIPETFNGEMRIYAIAASDTAAGAADTTTRIQSPIVVSANTPLFVAPNDKFVVNAVVSNLTDDIQSDDFNLSARATGAIRIPGKAATTLQIPANTEKLWTFDATAVDAPGAASVTIAAATSNEARSTTATLSVRPISTFTTHIQTGTIESDATTIRTDDIKMYPDSAVRKLYISNNADAVVRPLIEYLRHYDWSCSEQLTSRALPYALIPDSDMLGITRNDAQTHIADTINQLKNRQNDDGSFALWATADVNRNNANDANMAYVTAWVSQFLSIARDNGFDIPNDMLSRALDYLRTYAGTNIDSEFDASTHAFAIYVITRNEFVTTSYIDIFEEYANKNLKNWESKLMGAYIAASYKIMHQDNRADSLIEKYKPTAHNAFESTGDFDNNIADDSVYNYLRGHYFGAAPTAPSDAVRAYINRGDYDAYTAAAVIMGLAQNTGRANFATILVAADGVALTNVATGDGFVADIPAGANKISITCPDCNPRDTTLFWGIIQQGYPIATADAQNGIEITREYYDNSGQRITSGHIGDTVTVKIIARTRGAASSVSNAVIVDLMPGGFIADSDSLRGPREFAQFREDRTVIYTALSREPVEFTYQAQLGAAGTFAIPPIHAESMYNAAINATGRTGIFTVSNASDK